MSTIYLNDEDFDELIPFSQDGVTFTYSAKLNSDALHLRDSNGNKICIYRSSGKLFSDPLSNDLPPGWNE